MSNRFTSSASMRVEPASLMGSIGKNSRGGSNNRTISAPTPVDVEALFERWNRSLQTMDPKAVTANYTHDAVLLPTVEDEPHVGHAEITDYFTGFVKGKPHGVITERHVQIGWDMAVDMGSYTFTFSDGKEVSARYTFVYRPYAGEWLITHHHSSVLPEVFCGLGH